MLKIEGLTVEYGTLKAVEGVSLAVASGESLGVVGESGSGKSTIALAILRLLPLNGRLIAGKIMFNGQDLLTLAEPEMIRIRGAKISMIFQDPFTSLNPVFTIGEQISEVLRLHQGMNKREALSRAEELLGLVKIKDPADRIKDYPHQFSGGMRQRVMIAMALACHPEILIADEPTTALDVTIQAEILKLIKEIQQKLNFGIIYITHNFGIIKAMCERTLVMHKGKVVESGATGQIIGYPQNDYSKRLIGSLKALNSNG